MKENMIISLKQPKPALGNGMPTPPKNPTPTHAPEKNNNPTFSIVFVGVLLLLSVGAYYIYTHSGDVSDEKKPVSDSERLAIESAESEDIVARVSELIVLPEGEQPTIATVSDPKKLTEQAFFEKAKIGDRVLIYAKARKAYLYDPVADRLLEVAPIVPQE